MIGQSANGQGHEIFNLSEKELVYKQKVRQETLTGTRKQRERVKEREIKIWFLIY